MYYISKSENMGHIYTVMHFPPLVNVTDVNMNQSDTFEKKSFII